MSDSATLDEIREMPPYTAPGAAGFRASGKCRAIGLHSDAMKKYLPILQLAMMVAFIVVLATRWSYGEFLPVLLSAEWRCLLVIVGLAAAAAVLRGINLVYLVRRSHGELSLRLSIRFQLVSYFLNSFLFFNLGGDVALFFLLRRSKIPIPERVNLLFVDRATGVAGGLVCLAGFGVLSAPFVLSLIVSAVELLRLAHSTTAVWLVGALVVLVALTLGLCLLCRNRLGLAFGGFLRQVYQVWASQKGRWLWTFVGSTSISVALQLVKTALLYAAGLALGLEVPLGLLGVTAALAALVSMLPVTAAGLGVAELAIVTTYTQVGIPPEAALSVAILARLYWLVLGLAGWFAASKTVFGKVGQSMDGTLEEP